MTSSTDSLSRESFITINVWPPRQNIGHCSFSYGEKEKGEVIWSKYHAIQPAWTFVRIPFFPIPGRPITEFETDCKWESTDLKNLRMPDRYTFPVTSQQLSDIDAYATQSQKNIADGVKRYTYFPKCPLNGQVFPSLANLSYDDMPTSSDFSSENRNGQYSHCVQETREVA